MKMVKIHQTIPSLRVVLTWIFALKLLGSEGLIMGNRMLFMLQCWTGGKLEIVRNGKPLRLVFSRVHPVLSHCVCIHQLQISKKDAKTHQQESTGVQKAVAAVFPELPPNPKQLLMARAQTAKPHSEPHWVHNAGVRVVCQFAAAISHSAQPLSVGCVQCYTQAVFSPPPVSSFREIRRKMSSHRF